MDPARLTRLIDRVSESVSAPKVIRAYHGSPYDFNRFDAANIGTGEGSQAFGHGLYFASNEDVARYYRDTLGRQQTTQEIRDAIDLTAQISEKIRQINAMHGDPGAYGPAWQAQRGELYGELDSLQKRVQAANRPPGHMYEVEIAHPESDLLDLDSPAKGRHKAALMRAAFAAPENKWQKMAIEEITSRGTPSKIATESLLRAHNVQNENRMLGRAQAQAAVSEALMREGIPGARYFDQFSRTAGEGTRNYVIFPGAEDSIRILRKYGMLAPIPAAAAMSGEE